MAILPVAVRLVLLPVMPIPVPTHHDEFSYLLGGDTFASGRLTNPPHSMWVHFETFHVNQLPTYSSKYPPAQAVFLAIGEKFFGHPWFGVCLSVGLMCGAMCWMLQGWTSYRYALAGTALVILHWGITDYWMNSYWGGSVAAMAGALLIGAVPRLARRVTVEASLAASLGLMVLAFCRPYEGLFVAFACAAVLAVWMRRQKQPLVSLMGRRALVPFLLTMIPAAAAMGYYNYRVTGSITVFPYTLYEKTYGAAPLLLHGWQAVTPPAYRHEVFREYFIGWEQKVVRAAQADPLVPWESFRLWVAPFYFFNLLAPASLAGIIGGRRWEICAALGILGLACSGMLLETGFQAHYFAPMCGAYVVVAAAGLEATARWRIGARAAGRYLVPVWISIAAGQCCFANVRTGIAARTPIGIEYRPSVIQQLQGQGGRHLVIVRYGPHHFIHEDWVYNQADIDGSPIVWARDMGGRNTELLRYFDERKAWFLDADQRPPALTRIGSAK